MLILNAEQIRAWDAYTIRKEPIASIDLMERACVAFVNWYVEKYDSSFKVDIICGTGNNGGDGLGIARLLNQKKYDVAVWIIKSDKQSEDFKINRSRLPKEIPVVEFDNIDSFNINGSTIKIDAIFGTGLTRPVEGIYADVIKKINSTLSRVVAVDVPSGLQVDQPSIGEIIKAIHTVTFGCVKLPFMFPQYGPNVGQWHLIDIKLDPDYITAQNVFSKHLYVHEHFIDPFFHRDRSKFAHKGDFGRVLIIAGGVGKMGAAVLCARAALRSGAGLLTVHVPKVGYNIIQTSIPEAMASIDVNEDHFSDAGDVSNYDVIGVGPGIGVTSSTVSGLRKILQARRPMVLDADALNILSGSRELMHLIPPGSILTPHPGEFKRLVGEWNNDFGRLELQKKLAAQTKSIVVLKGAHTSIASPEGLVWFNSTGNPGMAKGGSGDVLTGILSALLAQGYLASEAAIIGVFIHGRAGDLAAEKVGQLSMLAGDLVEFLGQSFRR